MPYRLPSEEQLIVVSIWPVPEFSVMTDEHGVGSCPIPREEREGFLVVYVDGPHPQLGNVQMPPATAAVAVQHRLQTSPEGSHKEGFDNDQIAHRPRLNVVARGLETEASQPSNLLGAKL